MKEQETKGDGPLDRFLLKRKRDNGGRFGNETNVHTKGGRGVVENGHDTELHTLTVKHEKGIAQTLPRSWSSKLLNTEPEPTFNSVRTPEKLVEAPAGFPTGGLRATHFRDRGNDLLGVSFSGGASLIEANCSQGTSKEEDTCLVKREPGEPETSSDRETKANSPTEEEVLRET